MFLVSVLVYGSVLFGVAFASSGSCDTDADIHAQWTSNPFCECLNGDMYTEAISYERVPMLHPVNEVAANVGRAVLHSWTGGVSSWFNGGVADPTHDVVYVIFKCRSSGCRFLRTYEITRSGKQHRNGFYAKITKVIKRLSTPGGTALSYGAVEALYSEMWDKYGLVNNNCKHWSSDFWQKLKNAYQRQQ
ncbi:hypothetical protein AAVH_06762 [Aphelenchoides avenae]|nr:hypothetical protein AAVH_06762 [Aphelenchus avenae]